MLEPQSDGIEQALPIPKGVLAQESLGLSKSRTKKQKKNLRTGEISFLWISRLIIWVFATAILIPALWVVGSSFQPGTYFSPTLIPSGFTLQHYQDLLSQTQFLTWVRTAFTYAL